MQLFENESLILESDDKTLMLSTHRIRHISTILGKTHLVSILLNRVSAIKVHHQSWPLLLIFGSILTIISIMSLFNDNITRTTAGLCIGPALLLAYVATRRYMLSIIAIDGTQIHLIISGMSKNTLIDFIDKIEESILKDIKHNHQNIKQL